MKRTLLIVAALGMLSTTAFASRARYLSLSSFAVVEDQRETLVNPAKFNMFKNFAITEWGVAGNAVPRAEGGFALTAGSLVWGMYLGNNALTPAENLTAVLNGRTGFMPDNDRIELSVAGDMGIQWGATLYYSNGKDEAVIKTQKFNSLGLRLGAILMKDLEVYGDFDLKNTADAVVADADAKFEGKPGITLGAKYGMGEYKAYAEYAMSGWEVKKLGAAPANDEKFDRKQVVLGIGRKMEIDNKAKLFGDIHLANMTEKGHNNTTTTNDEFKTLALPVGAGMEVEALTWLVLRGSITQNFPILNSLEVKTAGVTVKSSMAAQSTTVNAGFALNYGDLKVDGLFSSVAANQLRFDNFGTNVAVSYWF